MLTRQILRIVLYGLGIASISSVVWMAGPWIVIGGYRPLQNYAVREIVILLIVTGIGSVGGAQVWKRLRGAKTVAAGMGGAVAEEDDAPVLKERMKDALATLKAAGKGSATYLYDLPWYLLVGPPGSGKTTALVNSGLKFPLAGGGRPAAVAGIGGTRYCDWWFTEDAVLIDTAGRYTTQDSDAKTDAKSWLAFLDVLKKGRPKQPINGVVLAISVSDLLTLSAADLDAHATAIRARLLELHTRLKVDFPVYALFTKADLILGFNEFFQNLDTLGRAQVFGATFQTADKTLNLVGQVPAEFDALLESLSVEMLDRLQDEPAPVTRVQLYSFPTQLAALKQPVFDFLNQVFEPTRYHANATLRGFYFTSGTQEGTPIDQLIGALERSFGTVELAPSAYSGQGRSYFLTTLLRSVIIGEAGWVSTDWRAVRRAAILKAVAYAAILLVCVGLGGLWWISYGRNEALIDRTMADVEAFGKADNGVTKQTLIGDRDFVKVLPLLDRVRDLPAGYAERDEPAPLAETFGLSQRERLDSAAVRSYHVALERLMRPRLLYRLEEVLNDPRSDPGKVYAALKVYKMLGDRHPMDAPVVLDWMRRDWADRLYPGEGNEAGRRALEGHLKAMLDLDDGQPLVPLSQPLLERSEAALAQLSLAQRAYELLKSRGVDGVADWSLARQGGPQLATVFEPTGTEPLSAIRVPAFYTYDGFQALFLGHLGAISKQIDDERWVLGDLGRQAAVQDQDRTLQHDLLDLYGRDFVAAWQGMFRKIRMKRFATDKSYVAVTAAASPTSPIKQLFDSVAEQTALTRPPKNVPATDGKAPSTAPALLQDGAPGAGIEEAFKGFQDMMAGDPGHRPIDQVLRTLGNIANDLKQQASNPSDRPQLNADLRLQISDLRNLAASVPAPFGAMLQVAASEFDTAEVQTAIGLLAQSLGEVTQACRSVVDNRYPFVSGAERDVGLVDFGRIFGPGGTLDGYFARNLDKFADRSRRDWTWRAGDPIGRALSPALLRSFQTAAQIRDAFFAGGGSQPSMMVTVVPPAITDPNVSARIDFYGTAITAQKGQGAPTAAPWPGSGSYQLKVTLTTGAPAPALAPVPTKVAAAAPAAGATDAIPPPPPPAPPAPPDISVIVDKASPWSLFHLFDEWHGNSHQYYSAGQYYRIGFSGPSGAPLSLSAVRQFQCPGAI